MKKFLCSCLLLCSAFGLKAQTTLFVNDNASGANNGSSWGNAFTSLDAALAAAVTGDQVWVAAGTYKPSNAAPNNSFIVKTGISLYGSFAGTETAISQRNIPLNPSILSGDIAGDDIVGNFESNRADNVIHVVRTTVGAANERATVDGFVISGGSTLLASGDPAAMKRGAGVSVEAKSTISNCKITDNRAESGSGLVATGTTVSGLVVSNCSFEKNDVTGRASGIYLLNVNGVEIKDCLFKENITVRGCVYPRTSSNISISNCVFQNNTSKTSGDFCAGIYSLSATYSVIDCQFIGNAAASASAMYLQNQQSTNLVTIKRCLFEENTSLNYGGCGVYSFDGNYSMDSCVFRKNAATVSAGAIYNGGASTFNVSNTIFEGNTGTYAAAVANYGLGTTGTFDHCTFTSNTAENGGGACSTGFKADVLYKNSTFQSNSAGFGGAIFTQNDTTRLRVDGCLFLENSADGSGGSIFRNNNIAASIRNSIFNGNTANDGAGIYARGDSILSVENCQFVNNIGLQQGVAVNLSNTVNAIFINTVMAANNNYSTEEGAGGALLNNASNGKTSTVKLLNCTIADNFSPIGSGLAQWEDDTSNSVMILQNCLLQNTIGENYRIEAGQPEVISQGGNQSSDDLLQTYFTAPKDLNSTLNEFWDPAIFDYHLRPGPAVNGGVAAGSPAKDIEGKIRDGQPDVGAYELGFVSAAQPTSQSLPLSAAPNPLVSQTILSLDHAWTGKARLELIATNGSVLRSIPVQKTAEKWQYELNMADFPAGTYQIQLIGDAIMFQSWVIKLK